VNDVIVSKQLRGVKASLMSLDLDAPGTVAEFNRLLGAIEAAEGSLAVLLTEPEVRSSPACLAHLLLRIIDVVPRAVGEVADMVQTVLLARGVTDHPTEVVMSAARALLSIDRVADRRLPDDEGAAAHLRLAELARYDGSNDWAIHHSSVACDLSTVDGAISFSAATLLENLAADVGRRDVRCTARIRIAECLVARANQSQSSVDKLLALEAAERAQFDVDNNCAEDPFLGEIRHLIASTPFLSALRKEVGVNAPVRFDLIDQAYEDLDRTNRTEWAHVDWNTLAVVHPGLERAVPIGTAAWVSKQSDNLRLTLRHEITHAFCARGNLLMVLSALRLEALRMEIQMLTEGASTYEEVASQMAQGRPAELEPGDLKLLTLGERQLECFRKSQILVSAWRPWLEGVAVHAELSRPTDDEASYDPAFSVLLNIDDSDVSSWQRAEQLYANAVDRLGATKLLNYMRNPADPYLLGYLAVRAVISSWRRRMPELSGEEASRVLVHLTRFGMDEAIPSLELSLPRFEAETVSRRISWFRTIASISEEDLRSTITRYATPGSRPFYWVNGKISDIFESDGLDRYRQAETWDDIVEHPEAESLRETLRATAARQLGSIALGEIVDSILQPTSVCVLARAKSRFMIPHTDRLVISIQARMPRMGLEASHSLSSEVLDADSIIQLRHEIERIGEPRIDVSRVADLHSNDEVGLRGFGSNYLVLRYGAWSHVERTGAAGGGEVGQGFIDDLEWQRHAPPALQFERTVVAPVAKCVSRTADWLDSTDRWHTQGHPVDANGWAERVRTLVTLISNPADTVNEFWSGFTATLLGVDVTDELSRNGLDALSQGGLKYDFICALLRSGHRAGDDSWLDIHVNELGALIPLVANRSGRWDVRAPDFPIQGN